MRPTAPGLRARRAARRRRCRSARRPAGSRARVPRSWPGSIGRFPKRAPRDLGGDEQHEHAEQAPERVLREGLRDLDARLDAADRRDSDHERGPPAHVVVADLPPRADHRRGQDRQQAGGLGVELRQPEHERERRDEQDPAADAEEAREDSRERAEHAGREQRPHQTSSRTPTAASNAANASESVRVARRCWSVVPATTPATAGRPTTAAAPTLISPWNAYVAAPTKEISAIAVRDVAIAGLSPKPAPRIRSGTTMIPPPTPKSALKRPATRPMKTSRTTV